MNLTIRYTSLLVMLLLTMFIAGNPTFTDDGGSTLRVFPYLVAVVPIPLVIAILVVHISRQSGVDFTKQQGLRSGELATRWSAIIFAVAVGMYALGFFSAHSASPYAMIVLFACSTAFVTTYLIGLTTAFLTTILILRRKQHFNSNSIQAF